MKKFIVCVAIFAAMLVVCACNGIEWNKETEQTEDIPVVDELDVSGAELISGVNSRYAMLSKINESGEIEVVASKNSSVTMYPASMTKVMTFIVAYENAASLEDKTEITKEMKNKYADASRIGIEEGDILTTEQLMYALLLESDTDAAIALAEYVAGSEDEFVKLMNEKCAELGLVSTNFANVTGLHDDEHYTTAQEMTKIFAYALEIDLFRKIITTDEYETYLDYYKDGVLKNYRITFKNTTISDDKGRLPKNNVSLTFGEDGRVLGGKTGYTDEAKQCLALLVTEGGDDYIIITARSSTQKDSAYDSIYICRNYIPTDENNPE